MSEIIKPEKSIWKLPDGSIWEGPLSELPKSSASLIAKAGKEYSAEWLKAQGWGKAEPKPKPKKKAAAKKPAETKAVKKDEVEDK